MTTATVPSDVLILPAPVLKRVGDQLVIDGAIIYGGRVEKKVVLRATIAGSLVGDTIWLRPGEKRPFMLTIPMSVGQGVYSVNLAIVDAETDVLLYQAIIRNAVDVR